MCGFNGAFIGPRFVDEEVDSAIEMEIVDDARAGAEPDSQSLVADGDTTIEADFEGHALPSDVKTPPSVKRGTAREACVVHVEWHGQRPEARGLVRGGFLGRRVGGRGRFRAQR